MSTILLFRLLGLVGFGSAGVALSDQIALLSILPQQYQVYIPLIGGILGAILGFIITPAITITPFHKLKITIQHLPAQVLLSGIGGLFIGLLLGALIAYPLSHLPGVLGQFLPIITAAITGYVGVVVTTTRPDILQSLRLRFGSKEPGSDKRRVKGILMDTSVIIDGRIADVCRTGFIQGELIVPLFVLNELQHVADSADTVRRNRGRRGLEILRQLQEESPVPVRLTDADVPEVREVDDKLIALARKLDAAILTNDYNLNQVAELQAVQVLNVNELANAVKTVLLPGENFSIHVLQPGKEPRQGVGYLEDGTMVVVEDGQAYIGQTIDVTVSKVLQTAAGRMIFARLSGI